jgi:hypothetical protein
MCGRCKELDRSSPYREKLSYEVNVDTKRRKSSAENLRL